jgi:hypothetical protein
MISLKFVGKPNPLFLHLLFFGSGFSQIICLNLKEIAQKIVRDHL